MTIETIVGTLPGTYKPLRPGTILHVDQLTMERRTNKKLPLFWFYTADGVVYALQGREKIPILAMTRGTSNPLFQASVIDAYCKQLQRKGNYRPSFEETRRALEASDTVLINLAQLKLSGDEPEQKYLSIDPKKWKKLNLEQRTLAERVYGPAKEFAANMEMCAEAGISEAKIFVLNPEYVQKYAQQGALGRASWLSVFVNNLCFTDVFAQFDYDGYALRGVRRRGVRSVAALENQTP